MRIAPLPPPPMLLLLLLNMQLFQPHTQSNNGQYTHGVSSHARHAPRAVFGFQLTTAE
jgi:hypothetical protein